MAKLEVPNWHLKFGPGTAAQNASFDLDDAMVVIKRADTRASTPETEKPPKHSCTPAASRNISAFQFFSFSMLAQPEGIECRLVDHRRRGEPLIGLVSGERLPGHRPEQSIHLTLVIAHLLQLGLHVRDHPVRRLSTLTHIDRSIVGIILGRRIVTPRRIPVAVIPVVITATYQFHTVVTRPIPTLIVPFRMIRAEYVVLRTLPLIASLNPIVLIVGNRRNLLRLWLRTKVRVLRLDLLSLRLDLLHLLRIGLLPARHISRRVLRAGCRNCGSCACGCRRRCRSSSR